MKLDANQDYWYNKRNNSSLKTEKILHSKDLDHGKKRQSPNHQDEKHTKPTHVLNVQEQKE
jgi:hypothetical protein